MNAHHSVAVARESFDILHPLDGHDGFSFGHGRGYFDEEAINEISGPRGAIYIQMGEEFCFVVPAAFAWAREDFAGELCVDLANEQLIPLTAYDHAAE